jgi:hypothetical protein
VKGQPEADTIGLLVDAVFKNISLEADSFLSDLGLLLERLVDVVEEGRCLAQGVRHKESEKNDNRPKPDIGELCLATARS